MNAGRAIALLAMMAGFAGVAQAQTQVAQTTQQVSYEVRGITAISFAGSPSLLISTATAGSALDSATAAATWNITTNQLVHVTASIASAMPSGLTLSVKLAAPTSTGTSDGEIALSTTAANVVNGIGPVAGPNLSVTYVLQAALSAGVVAPATTTVTYTVLTGA